MRHDLLETIVSADAPAAECPDCGTATAGAKGHTPYAQVCPACGTVLDVAPRGFADPDDPAKGLRYEVRRMEQRRPVGPFDPNHSASYPP